MEANSQHYDSALYNQLEEAYGKVVYSYTTQVIHAGRLHERYKALKWGQLILSAVSTGGFIGTLVSNKILLTWVGGVCSTVLLVLTAYFKESDLSANHKRHLDTSNHLWLLREQYLSLLTDFSTLSREEIVSRRDELQVRVADVYDEAPLTDAKSYSLAQKALKENESLFFTRNELNQMLPESLRKTTK
ncbi:SLATT domain-containing protein [Cloacibacillus porcorum]